MPAKLEREQLIRDFYNAIDVSREIDFEDGGKGRSLPSGVYVDNLHQDGFYLPRKALYNAIRNNASAERYFFAGMRGSGKSTELRRLKRDLEDSGELVVFYADMTEYLPLNSAVEIGDFLLAVLGALADCVRIRFGEDLAKADFVDRLVSFLKTEVQIEGIDWSADSIVGKLGFKFKLKENPHFKALLQAKSRGVVDGLVKQSREFVDGVVDFVRAHTYPDRRVVFIVDSVERLSGIGEEAKRVFESVENLFGSHRDKLRFATLTVIYSVPPYISAVAQAGCGNIVYSLPLTHVFHKPEPGKHGAKDPEGVGRIVDVIQRRFAEWSKLISKEHLERLIVHTGGDLRELFLLLREALNLIDPQEDSHFPIPEPAIAQAEKLRRNQFGIIPDREMTWLKSVVETHGHCLPGIGDLGTLARLLDGKLIFQYRNGDNWYDVHPLLWDQVSTHAAATAGS